MYYIRLKLLNDLTQSAVHLCNLVAVPQIRDVDDLQGHGPVRVLANAEVGCDGVFLTAENKHLVAMVLQGPRQRLRIDLGTRIVQRWVPMNHQEHTQFRTATSLACRPRQDLTLLERDVRF